MNAINIEFKERVITTFRSMKFEFVKHPDVLTIPFYQQGHARGRLRPLHANFTSEDVRLLVEWRNQNREAFFTWIIATEEGTEKWLREQILHREDRLLLFIETLNGVPFGHIGLTNFDFSSKACEIDNVLRGKAEFIRGGMSAALQALVNWVFVVLNANSVYLRVFCDNHRAVDFYKRNGLRIVKRVPLRRIDEGNMIRWIEAEEEFEEDFERYVLYLSMERDEARGVSGWAR